MEFSFSKNEHLLEITIRGEATIDTLTEMIRTLIAHVGWNPGVPLLIDESAMETDKLSVEDVREVANFCVASRKALGNARVAILVSRDLEYGMNRMFLAFVENRWDADSNVFKSRAEALRWLG